jgi:hypothetical protein
MTFGAMPSGATYVSDAYGLVKVVNDSSADQAALQNAGCYLLTPFGGWGTMGFNYLVDLYAADTGSILPGITGYPQHTIAAIFNDASTINGTWVKTGSGNGSGNWTKFSSTTLASLAADFNALAISFNDTVGLGAGTVQAALVELFNLLPPLIILGTPPATGAVGTPYSFIPTTFGGRAPYTFKQTGALPPGLSFDPATGILSATPTEGGTYPNITISVTDKAGHTAQLTDDPFTITITGGASGTLDFRSPDNSGLIGH